jgi:RNA polymerase sigma-70 factor (ECF subfamily)
MEISDESELIKGCIKGDRRYQELLYLKFCRKMMGVCFRYSKNKEEAEDILQDAFIRIFSRLHQFRNDGSFEGWVRKIVLSTIYDSFRKKTFLVVVTDQEIPEENTDISDFMSEIDFEELLSTIRELAPGYRTIFNMYAVDGYTHREIAQLLGISEGTSKSQYAAARRILQKKLRVKTIHPSNHNEKKN